MSKLYLSLIWHQHQPYYMDPFTGEFSMPWVRLHAIKDYIGMGNLLAEAPGVKQVMNFVPSLVQQINQYLGGAVDTAMVLARTPADSLSEKQAIAILDTFFMAHWGNMINVYPRYRQLLEKRAYTHRTAQAVLRKFSAADFRDLQAWHDLAWFHPTVVEKDSELQALIAKGKGYTEEDKAFIIARQLDIMAKVVPLHRRLAESGQLELITSPFYHPILPLLCDYRTARVARPDMMLPVHMFTAPEDAAAQVERGLAHHERSFGARPRGMWPSECSVSDDASSVIARAGVQWIVTDEEILGETLKARFTRDSAGHVLQPEELYKPYRLESGGRDLNVVFRDHVLSDFIGFRYYYQKPADAAKDFMTRLEWISAKAPANSLVVVALDGENCWEHYRNQGVEFIRELYRLLAISPQIETTRVSEYLDRFGPGPKLDTIFPGSWIGHSFSTWMGHAEKNRGWEYLAQARHFLTTRVAEGGVPPEKADAALEEIYIAEGSDWYWWYGDDHSSGNDAEFDSLFRKHVRKVYDLLDVKPPDELLRPIISKTVHESWRPPRGALSVRVDGQRTTFFEWLAAGVYEQARDSGAMQRSEPVPISAMYFGFGADSFFLRLDTAEPDWAAHPDLTVELWFDDAERPAVVVRFGPDGPSVSTATEAAGAKVQAVRGRIMEIATPLKLLGLAPGRTTEFSVRILEAGSAIQCLPGAGSIPLSVPQDIDSAYSGGEDLV